MAPAKCSLALFATLLALPSSAQADTQARMAKECMAEIQYAEKRIAAARKQPAYHSDEGRQVLTSADRALNQARGYAVKGESRSCVTAAKKAAGAAR
jgi:hypothetical protein